MEEEPCYLLSTPNELQKMIYDKLAQKDKDSYGRSSRKCRNIWEDSSGLFDSICWEKTSSQLVLSSTASHSFIGSKMEFNLESNTYRIEPHDKQFRRCENSYVMAQNKFSAKLEKHQDTVRSITIWGKCPIILSKNVKSFRNLQNLRLSGDDWQISREILSKTGDRLKYLKIASSIDYSMFDAIYRAQDFLWIYFELNREQLFRLIAKEIEMPMGKLKAQDIFDFIRGWQNGTRDIEYCKWNQIGVVDVMMFFRLFNAKFRLHQGYKRLSIRGPGLKAALLTYNKNLRLSFKTIKDKDLDWNYDSDGDTFYRKGSNYKYADEFDD